jgi:hypothetical protein
MRSVARAIDLCRPKKAREPLGIEGGERGYNAGKACATFENRFHPVEIRQRLPFCATPHTSFHGSFAMPNFTNLRSPARARTASSRSSDGLKSSARHHIANRGRMPLPTARRSDPTRVHGLGEAAPVTLPQYV